MNRIALTNGKRLLLVEPPFYRLFKDTYSLETYPLSLGYLGAVVSRDSDWTVQVYNADFVPNGEVIQVGYMTGQGYANYLSNLDAGGSRDASVGGVWAEIREAILAFRPSVIGISSKSQNFASTKLIARIAKQIDPSVIVVIGGPHPSLVKGAALAECKDIDALVFGEGEATLLELLERIGSGRELQGMAGTSFRADGQVIQGLPREPIKDLDSLPFPHEYAPRILKDYGKYSLAAFRSVFAIRGCPYNCSFCGSRYVWSQKVRFRSPENVAAEVSGLQKLGLRTIRFDDDTFGVRPDYIRQLCSTLAEKCQGMRFSCELHVRLVNEEVLRQLRAAGCEAIQLGIESGDNGILKEIRKNITIEQGLAASRMIGKAGMVAHTFFMIGFPQETEETLLRTKNAMKTIHADGVMYSIFTPYPNTELFELCKQQGTVRDDHDVSLYNHQSSANHFCPAIPRERFRELALEIERMVDAKNNRTRVRRMFSLRTLQKVRELGARAAIAKANSLLRYYLRGAVAGRGKQSSESQSGH
jgi:anaerobic magnesium-protoporphyrin IX monomethyl ester cyclase